MMARMTSSTPAFLRSSIKCRSCGWFPNSISGFGFERVRGRCDNTSEHATGINHRGRGVDNHRGAAADTSCVPRPPTRIRPFIIVGWSGELLDCYWCYRALSVCSTVVAIEEAHSRRAAPDRGAATVQRDLSARDLRGQAAHHASIDACQLHCLWATRDRPHARREGGRVGRRERESGTR